MQLVDEDDQEAGEIVTLDRDAYSVTNAEVSGKAIVYNPSFLYKENKKVTAEIMKADVFSEHLTGVSDAEGLIGYYATQIMGADYRYTPDEGWRHWDGSKWKLLKTTNSMKLTVSDIGRKLGSIYAHLSKKSEEQHELDKTQIDNTDDEVRKEALVEKLNRFEAKLNWQKWAGGRSARPMSTKSLCDRGEFVNKVIKHQLEPRCEIEMEVWDRKSRQLIVGPTRTFEIANGVWRPNRVDDYMTTTMAHDYDPNAECPNFERVLREALPDQLEREFFQRVIGYAWSGLCEQNILLINVGEGQNGKSVIFGGLQYAAGKDYACSLPPSFLMQKHGGAEGHPTELYDLKGKRLVHTDELPVSGKFDEKRLKMLSGGGSIRARLMHKDFIEFEPTHTFIISTNHMATVRGTDFGVWRRLLILPWRVTVPTDKIDPQLGHKMKSEGPGITRWAIDGLMDYLARGRKIDPPQSVKDVVSSYRQEQDILGNWLNDFDYVASYGVGVERESARAKEVYASVRSYFQAHNIPYRSMSDAEIKQDLSKRRDRSGKSLGIRWRSNGKYREFTHLKLADSF